MYGFLKEENNKVNELSSSYKLVGRISLCAS